LWAAIFGLKIAVPARVQKGSGAGADEFGNNGFNYKDNVKTARGFYGGPQILLT
jgi:hypothetical protein